LTVVATNILNKTTSLLQQRMSHSTGLGSLHEGLSVAHKPRPFCLHSMCICTEKQHPSFLVGAVLLPQEALIKATGWMQPALLPLETRKK
jgi:hypothetical protein